MFAGLWYMCMLCDLSIRPSCSNNPATYGSPSIGLCGLLFVLGGLFALDDGGASAHSGLSWHCGRVPVEISCLQLW